MSTLRVWSVPFVSNSRLINKTVLKIVSRSGFFLKTTFFYVFCVEVDKSAAVAVMNLLMLIFCLAILRRDLLAPLEHVDCLAAQV